jgi:hypothetical protein
MIFPGSRYSRAGNYTVTRCGGAPIAVLKFPLPGPAVVQGYYRRAAAQRLDLIASFFLKDATMFWRLCDGNNSVVPDALAAWPLIGVPANPQ